MRPFSIHEHRFTDDRKQHVGIICVALQKLWEPFCCDTLRNVHPLAVNLFVEFKRETHKTA